MEVELRMSRYRSSCTNRCPLPQVDLMAAEGDTVVNFVYANETSFYFEGKHFLLRW